MADAAAAQASAERAAKDKLAQEQAQAVADAAAQAERDTAVPGVFGSAVAKRVHGDRPRGDADE